MRYWLGSMLPLILVIKKKIYYHQFMLNLAYVAQDTIISEKYHKNDEQPTTQRAGHQTRSTRTASGKTLKSELHRSTPSLCRNWPTAKLRKRTTTDSVRCCVLRKISDFVLAISRCCGKLIQWVSTPEWKTERNLAINSA